MHEILHDFYPVQCLELYVACVQSILLRTINLSRRKKQKHARMEDIKHQRKNIHEPHANKQITSLSAAASMTMMNP